MSQLSLRRRSGARGRAGRLSGALPRGSRRPLSGAEINAKGALRLAPSLARALAGEAIRVGTENQAKLGAVRSALGGYADDASALVLVPVGVASGVPEQPIGFSQIVAGARNRARAALESGECVLAVGIEDGLVQLADGMGDGPATPSSAQGSDPAEGDRRAEGFHSAEGFDNVFNLGCAWITDGEREGHGFSSGFAYPAGCLEPAMRDQAPIGDLFDALWRSNRGVEEGARAGTQPAKASPSGRKAGARGGNIGLLTDGRLGRSDYGSGAVVCALVRFLHTDLYD